jgi:hypothetical protein
MEAAMEAGTGMEMAVGAAVAAGAVDPRHEWLCFPGV